MTKTQELLAQVKEKHSLTSDYQLAMLLGESRQTISHLLSGKRQADPTVAAKIGDALNMEAIEVIAKIETEAARTEEKRAYWRDFLNDRGRAAALIGAIILTSTQGGDVLANKAISQTNDAINGYYVKSLKWICRN